MFPVSIHLCALREVCLRAVISFFARRLRRERRVFIFFSVLRWRWRGRKLRYDESAQRVYPPPPPCRVLTPVSGGESVTTENTAQADCPPETGATRSEATEGVDKPLIR